jgi:hypothetical protein
VRERKGERSLELYVEVAPGGDALVHAPSLPGFSVKVGRGASRERRLRADLSVYARWAASHGLGSALRAASALREADWREVETVAGAPVWISGNAAVLFSVDRRPLSNREVMAHLDVVAAALSDMAEAVAGLSLEERARGRRTGGRSINETLTHVGNCIWWYASRIDDKLPEPEEDPAEAPLDRCVRLLADARAYLGSISGKARVGVHVPTRFPTYDPSEPWTHAKACRREAEHAWDHLAGVRRAAAATRRRLPRPTSRG